MDKLATLNARISELEKAQQFAIDALNLEIKCLILKFEPIEAWGQSIIAVLNDCQLERKSDDYFIAWCWRLVNKSIHSCSLKPFYKSIIRYLLRRILPQFVLAYLKRR